MLQISVQDAHVDSIDDAFAKHWEVDLVLALQEFLDLRFGPALLIAKLVARECKDL